MLMTEKKKVEERYHIHRKKSTELESFVLEKNVFAHTHNFSIMYFFVDKLDLLQREMILSILAKL